MAKNRIVIGEDVYTDADIRNGNVYLSSSLAADELSIDTLDVTADVTSIVPTIFRPKNSAGMMLREKKLYGVLPNYTIVSKQPVDYQYAQPVQYYHGDKLVGTFYLSSVERTGIYTYSISCISAIGLLANSTHYGGVYDGVKFETLAKDIIGENISCAVTNELKNILVYGHLPIATRRENLHQLLFATGTMAETGEYNGKPSINIVALTESAPKEIDASNLYVGGSVDLNKQISRVIVTEHSYIKDFSKEKTTLYEGVVEASLITTPKGRVVDGALLTFSNPAHTFSFESDGAIPEILEEDANYIVVGPIGYCKLLGYEYNHTTRQITRDIGNKARSLVNVQDNDAVVDNATLVSLANSENVADRVMAYYKSAKTIKVGFVVDGENPGYRIAFHDPFDESATGYIKSMDISMSRKLKSNSEVVEGYVPTGIGNNYKNIEVKSGSVTFWYAPEGVTKVRIVVIGGGQGGWSGFAGEDGENAAYGSEDAGKSGNGGNVGDGGKGGNIYIATINVVPGARYNMSFGVGGNGGVCNDHNSEEGSFGTETVFYNNELGVSISSSSGSLSPDGYVDVIEGNVYAKPGKPGIVNGGTTGDQITVGGSTYVSGVTGETDIYSSSSWSAEAYGGLGGGPAYGGTGGSGKDGGVNRNTGHAYGGDGGGGANANPTSNATGIGEGGQGGSGGGGGGGGGGSWSSQGTLSTHYGLGGKGGKGGRGGNGGPGGVIIYY